MTTLAHVSVGYMTYLSIVNITGADPNGLMLVSLVGANAPDFDILSGKGLTKHRESWLHAPVFWIAAYLISIMLNRIIMFSYLYVHVFFINVFIHMVLDWFSGRAAGVRIFYPFSKKDYTLYKFKAELDKNGVVSKVSYLDMFKSYLENKLLVIVEWGLVFAGLALAFVNG